LFSILTAWLYPTLLAPLFNKFKPLESGELKSSIDTLASKVGFKSDGVFVMDASTRSAHGNAYFTGVFGKKRIVLFDTLLKDMSAKEVTAVLAHELGHFKLNHIRNAMIRGLVMSLGVFYLMSLLVHHSVFYEAFGLADISNYAGLVIFMLWFSLVEFLLQPLETWLSRSNEFAADQFAKENLGGSADMMSALKKLREKSFVMPISDPLYSAVYHSHPPMLERLRALK
jgi:STE24 endopeptidase